MRDRQFGTVRNTMPRVACRGAGPFVYGCFSVLNDTWIYRTRRPSVHVPCAMVHGPVWYLGITCNHVIHGTLTIASRTQLDQGPAPDRLDRRTRNGAINPWPFAPSLLASRNTSPMPFGRVSRGVHARLPKRADLPAPCRMSRSRRRSGRLCGSHTASSPSEASPARSSR